jgi:adenosylmethionine-8-amino-7-oxononanoate aminotransferase
MAGVDLGEHDPALRLGHRVTLEARERGAIVRPLGDTVVLMPPLAIAKAELRRLVGIVAESIHAAYEGAYGAPEPAQLRPTVAEPAVIRRAA